MKEIEKPFEFGCLARINGKVSVVLVSLQRYQSLLLLLDETLMAYRRPYSRRHRALNDGIRWTLVPDVVVHVSTGTR